MKPICISEGLFLGASSGFRLIGRGREEKKREKSDGIWIWHDRFTYRYEFRVALYRERERG